MRARIVIVAPRLTTGVGRLTHSRARPVVIPITATAHRALADQLARHLVPIDGVEVPIAEPSAPARYRRAARDGPARLHGARHGRRDPPAVPVRVPDPAAHRARRRPRRHARECRALRAAGISVRRGEEGVEPLAASGLRGRAPRQRGHRIGAAVRGDSLRVALRHPRQRARRCAGRGWPAGTGQADRDGCQDRWPAIPRAAAHGTRLSARAATLARRARRRAMPGRTSGHSSRSDCSARACWRRRNDITSVPTVCSPAGS